jgi:hypothetical protein
MVDTQYEPFLHCIHDMLIRIKIDRLSRFELPSTDIVLLGHSMGGILAAEVALLQSPMGGRLHASILGIIAFDTPFLGMHPGVISSGIASLFRSPSSPPENSEEGLDPFFTARPTRNFTIVSSKKEQPTSWRESAENFAAKHKGRVTEAAREYLVSHLKFGACLMDPAGLTSRYAKIRHLEDGTEDMGRVRIANYYTESYGGEDAAVEEQSVLLPEPTPVVPEQNDTNRSQSSYTVGSEMENLSLSTSSPRYLGSSPSTPFLTNPTDPRNAPHQIVVPPPPPYTEIPNSPSSNPTISLVPATPIDLDPSTQLPPLPLAPPEQPPDLHPIPSDADKHLCKALKKENKRLIKEHERAVREHAALVHKREKTIESILKMRGKEERKRKAKEVKAIKHQSHPRPSETGGSENELQNLPGVNFGKEPGTSLGNNSHYTAVTVPIEDSKPLSSYSFQQRKNLDQNMSEYNLLETNPHITKKRNPKRFCILPHNYKQDHTWTAVEMTGVDEVGAHCGLFFVGPVYERLVGDVAARIEVWVDDYREYRRQFGIDELGVNQPWND